MLQDRAILTTAFVSNTGNVKLFPVKTFNYVNCSDT